MGVGVWGGVGEKWERTKSGERVNERESINCALCAGALLLSVAVEVRALTPPAARRDLNRLSDCCIPMQLDHSKACLKLHPHYATHTHIHTLKQQQPLWVPSIVAGRCILSLFEALDEETTLGSRKKKQQGLPLFLSILPHFSLYFLFLSLSVFRFPPLQSISSGRSRAQLCFSEEAQLEVCVG